jgi:cytochrome c556
MKHIARTLGVGALFAAALTLTVPGADAIAADGKETIEKRIALMKGGVLKNYLYAKKFVKEGKGTAAGVSAHAHLLNDASKQIVAHFPKGTGRGDFDEKTTRALPKIWEDWDGFKTAAAALAAESAKLAEVAAGGDKEAIAAQFGKMGKLGCGGCHKPFRGAKVKE